MLPGLPVLFTAGVQGPGVSTVFARSASAQFYEADCFLSNALSCSQSTTVCVNSNVIITSCYNYYLRICTFTRKYKLFNSRSYSGCMCVCFCSNS